MTSGAASQLDPSLPIIAQGGTWGYVPDEALDALNARIFGVSGNGAPLGDLFNTFGPEAQLNGAVVLNNALAGGMNPDAISGALAGALNTTQQRAQVIARNEMLGAYRDAQRANFQANSDVIQGWMWSCAPDACMVCVFMDGSEHPLDEDMDSHVDCRCAMLPITMSWSDLFGQWGIDGEDIPETSIYATYEPQMNEFLLRNAQAQQQVMGKAAWEAWQRGDVKLADLVGTKSNEEWGDAVYQKSLKELGLNARDYLGENAQETAFAGNVQCLNCFKVYEGPLEGARFGDVVDPGNAMSHGYCPECTADVSRRDFLTQTFTRLNPNASEDEIAQLVDAQMRKPLTENLASQAAGEVEAESAAPSDLAARVVYGDDSAAAALRGALGHDLSDDEIAGLVGHPDGAEITVNAAPDGQEVQGVNMRAYLTVRTDDGSYYAFRGIGIDANGEKVMIDYDSHLASELQGHGIGTRLFADQVQELSSQGYDRILLSAGREEGQNGFWSYARMGVDGPLPESVVENLPDELRGATRVSDLMSTPEGQAWWKANGATFDGTFDLTPGSDSMKALDDYLQEKGIAPLSSDLAAGEMQYSSLPGEWGAKVEETLGKDAAQDWGEALGEHGNLQGPIADRAEAQAWTPMADSRDVSQALSDQLGAKVNLDDMHPAAANQFAQTLQVLQNDFPEVMQSVDYIGMADDEWLAKYPQADLGPASPRVAASNGPQIAFNQGYFDANMADLSHTIDILERNAEDGWYFDGAGSPASQVAHEFGHSVLRFMEQSENADIRQMASDWVASWNPGTAGTLGEYATTSADEAFAEAFAATYFGSGVALSDPLVEDMAQLLADIREALDTGAASELTDAGASGADFEASRPASDLPRLQQHLVDEQAAMNAAEQAYKDYIANYATSPEGIANKAEQTRLEGIAENARNALSDYMAQNPGLRDATRDTLYNDYQKAVSDYASHVRQFGEARNTPQGVDLIKDLQTKTWDVDYRQAEISEAQGGRGAIVHFGSDYQHYPQAEEGVFNQVSQQAFGRVLSRDEIAGMVGAPEGSYVEVTTSPAFGDEGMIQFEVHGPEWEPMADPFDVQSEPEYEATRYLKYNTRTGQQVMQNALFKVREDLKGQGLGLQIFSDEVDNLTAMGVRKIETEGAGNLAIIDEWNGYYTWPKFGYNGRIPDDALAALRDAAANGNVPAAWGRYTTIQQLYSTPEGEAWWKANGQAIDLEFDLRDGSYSHRLLQAYLRRKGIIQ